MARDDLLISTNEREFILRALRENELRVDGRGPLDVRPCAVSQLAPFTARGVQCPPPMPAGGHTRAASRTPISSPWILS